MMKKLSEMLETRKLIALLVVGTACYMAVASKIDSKDFFLLASNVAVFYFGFKKE